MKIIYLMYVIICITSTGKHNPRYLSTFEQCAYLHYTLHNSHTHTVYARTLTQHKHSGSVHTTQELCDNGALAVNVQIAQTRTEIAGDSIMFIALLFIFAICGTACPRRTDDLPIGNAAVCSALLAVR